MVIGTAKPTVIALAMTTASTGFSRAGSNTAASIAAATQNA